MERRIANKREPTAFSGAPRDAVSKSSWIAHRLLLVSLCAAVLVPLQMLIGNIFVIFSSVKRLNKR